MLFEFYVHLLQEKFFISDIHNEVFIFFELIFLKIILFQLNQISHL